MRNNFTMYLELTRIEVCDLLIACLSAEHAVTDGGTKWSQLHDKIKAQLHRLDEQLDEIED